MRSIRISVEWFLYRYEKSLNHEEIFVREWPISYLLYFISDYPGRSGNVDASNSETGE